MEICQERETQSAILCKGLVTPSAIHRNAEDLRVMVVKLRQYFVVKCHLIAAHRAPVGRIERQHDRPASKIAQREILVGCYAKRKAGSDSTGRQYLRHSFSP